MLKQTTETNQALLFILPSMQIILQLKIKNTNIKQN